MPGIGPIAQAPVAAVLSLDRAHHAHAWFVGAGGMTADTIVRVSQFSWRGDSTMVFAGSTDFIQLLKSGDGLLTFSAEVHLRAL